MGPNSYEPNCADSRKYEQQRCYLTDKFRFLILRLYICYSRPFRYEKKTDHRQNYAERIYLRLRPCCSRQRWCFQFCTAIRTIIILGENMLMADRTHACVRLGVHSRFHMHSILADLLSSSEYKLRTAVHVHSRARRSLKQMFVFLAVSV